MAAAAAAISAAVSFRPPPPALRGRPFSFLLRPRPHLQPIPRPLPFRSSRERLFPFCCLKDGRNGETSERKRGGDSTMPDRFRHLLKEVPEQPVRWPWAIALGFLIYCWRTVLRELGNWEKAAIAVVCFFGYLLKLILAFMLHLVRDPLTVIIECIKACLYTIKDIYKDIVGYVPVPELLRVSFFSLLAMSIAEAVVPDAVNSQQFMLLLAGIVGFGAALGYIPAVLYWFFLLAFFSYSYFVKKKDIVTAALPSITVLVAVGEPWVICLAISLYMGLAITHHSKASVTGGQEAAASSVTKLPIPLHLIAFSIGIHVAAKWVRRRHLTWMIS